MYSFSYLEGVCCSMSSSNCCFLTCIQVSQEAGQVVWYSHLFQNFPQFIVIHTVKGFGIVNKAIVWVILAKYHRLGNLTYIYFSQSWRLEVQGHGASVVWEKAFLWLQFSLCPYMVQKSRGHCGFSFIRTVIPFMRAPPSWCKHLPMAPVSNTMILGVRILA